MKSPIIYCFKNDLRLLDNPALQYAVETDRPIFFVYIYDSETDWAPGAASCWWLHQSLLSMFKDLADLDATLYFFTGSAIDILPKLAKEIQCDQIVYSRTYEPAALNQDRKLLERLNNKNIDLTISQGNILFRPGSILNKQGNTYKVFTPFYKACREFGIPSLIIEKPKSLLAFNYQGSSLSLDDLKLLPKKPWVNGLKAHWKPGEKNANQQLKKFVAGGVFQYSEKRDFPNLDSTSHLSPYLHFGELSPQRVIYHLTQIGNEKPTFEIEAEKIIRQLVWREFACHILVSYPFTTDKPFQAKFSNFPWKRSNKKLSQAWQQGKTGYPLIDAGMRELWATGYMHNRVRMIVASFLTKNGMLHWKKGALWFWDTLVDADLAQNSMNWQWVAGCGVDAAPYFRIFNPVTQSKKFDSAGNYIRRWCPELKDLPSKYIHAPWEAPDDILNEANVTLGLSYPEPILDLKITREEALLKYRDLIMINETIASL